uniref:Phosphatidylglycerophosphatase and protein-tyrosine phosphatase 1 n=1 Tax=Panagrellus redivivus TaxID=6233 RepID=A0A7E4ZUB8_PANRE
MQAIVWFVLKMLGSIAFYPSLAYNLVRNYVQPQRWQWYNRVDENLVLGALPFKSMVTELKENENIGGVVCCTEEFETKAAYNAMDEAAWAKEGIKFHHVPMQDFTGSTSRHNLHSAVEFIDGVAKEGKSVYVHCKAGRTRSATVATCYLMYKYNYMPNVAIDIMKRQRHQIILRNAHWRSVNEYRRFLDSANSSKSTETSS